MQSLISEKQTAGLKGRIAILNHAGHSSYGSSLTAFALQEHLGRRGYFVRTVSLRPYREPDEAAIKPFNSFINNYLLFTDDVYGAQDCVKLNEHFDTFIAGSDQIWRFSPSARRQTAGAAFLLDFAAQGKKRIAYAGSFGLDRSSAPAERKQRMKDAFADLDAISCREIQGVQCLAEDFGIDQAKHVLDPVFLLSLRDWQRFSEASTQAYPSNLLSYCSFFFAEQLYPQLSDMAAQKHLQSMPLLGIEVMNWLHAIEQSQLVVTDSFHVLCFALIYERPFVAVSAPEKGMARLASILQVLGLEDRLINLDTLPPEQWRTGIEEVAQKPLNYAKINETIARMQADSIAWLDEALAKEPKPKKYVLSYDAKLASAEREPLRIIERGHAKAHFKATLKSLLKLKIGQARHQCSLALAHYKTVKSL